MKKLNNRKNLKSFTGLMFVFAILVTSTQLNLFISTAHADDPEDPPLYPPGVRTQEWDIGPRTDCDFEVHYDYQGYVAEGLDLYPDIVEDTYTPQIPFMNGPNSFGIPEEDYIIYDETDLNFQEIYTYVPMVLVESDEWYSHTFQLTTAASQTTTINTNMEMGGQKGVDMMAFSGGQTYTTMSKSVNAWSYTAEAGETIVIYIPMDIIRIYGNVTYLVLHPYEGQSEVTVEYDVLIVQTILWNNPHEETYNAGIEPAEIPHFETTYLDPETYDYLPGEFVKERSHIKSHAITCSADIFLLSGSSDSKFNGVFIGGGIEQVSAQDNELTFKHTFNRVAENIDNQYFDNFNLIYEDAISVNIQTNTVSPDYAAPGILDEPWYKKPEQDLPWEMHGFYLPPGIWLYDGFTTDLEPQYSNVNGYFEGPIAMSILNEDLTYREIEAYVPFILLETEEWYSHSFSLTTSQLDITEIITDVTIGYRYYLSSISYSTGESTKEISKITSGWTETVPAGETWVIYLKVKFVQQYGTVEYSNHDVIEYDAVFVEDIFFDHIFPVKYNSSETPQETPIEDSITYGDDSHTGLPDTYSEERSVLELHTTSSSIDLGYVSGDSGWIGLYIDLHLEDIYTQQSEIVFKHIFNAEEGINQGEYFERFRMRYDNAFSINIKTNWLPEVEAFTPDPGSVVSGTLRFKVYIEDHGTDPMDMILQAWISRGDNDLDDPDDAEIVGLRWQPNVFQWYWDITTWEYEDDRYYMVIYAEDAFGDYTWNKDIFFDFSNDDVDNSISQGDITSPSGGSTHVLGDDITFMATASDEVEGVHSVHYKVDSGAWNSAYYSSFYQRWMWTWYDQPSSPIPSSYTIYCRVTDDEGNQVIVDSVTITIDYGTILTHQITPVEYYSYSGTVTSGKYDDNSYFMTRCKGVGWGWWRSKTDFYFSSPALCLSTRVEIQITPCTPSVTLYIYYTDGSYETKGLLENTYNTQLLTLSLQGKTINRIRVQHLVWWATYQRVYVDFIRVRYKVT